MEEIRQLLALIWFVLLGLILALYVILDGFDLGVGILSLFTGSERRRSMVMTSLATVWDANEVWLVIWGGALFGAFPKAYGLRMNALYAPVVLLVIALIFRGVAFEFRSHSDRKRLWSLSFGAGSLAAAVAQGFILGGVLSGVRVDQAGHFAGGPFDWATPLTLVVTAGVVFGYAMLGGTYLILKTTGPLQRAAHRWATVFASLAFGTALFTLAALPFMHSGVARRWVHGPVRYYLGALVLAAMVFFVLLLLSLRRRGEKSPFLCALGVFGFTFLPLWVGLYPGLLPDALGVQQAAATARTLAFMLAGVGMLIPVIMVYNGYVYMVFRGKVESQEGADAYGE